MPVSRRCAKQVVALAAGFASGGVELASEVERYRWLNTCFLVGEGEIDEDREQWWMTIYLCANEEAQGPPALGSEPPREEFRQRGRPA